MEPRATAYIVYIYIYISSIYGLIHLWTFSKGPSIFKFFEAIHPFDIWWICLFYVEPSVTADTMDDVFINKWEMNLWSLVIIF